MKFYKLTLCALALMGAVACNDGDDINGHNSDQGALVFDLNSNQDVEVVTRASISSVTGYTAPTKDAFTFIVTDDDGYEAWSGKIADLTDGKLPLKAGTYSVEAVYNEGNMGSPVFEGEVKNVTINGGKDTSVVVPVSLSNSIVKFEFDEMFAGYYSWSDFTLSSVGGSKTITYGANQTQGVFVNSAALTVKGTLTSQAQNENYTSQSVDFEKTFSISAGKCYTLKFKASNIGNAGTITIEFGDVEEEINMDIEINPEE